MADPDYAKPYAGRLLLAGVMGAAACGVFWLAFPEKTLAKITHGLVRLPGPGSAVCVIYGPVVIALSLFSVNVLRRRWVLFTAGSAFGLLHGLFTPLVYPGVETLGSVGPWPLRVLAVVLTALVLELLVFALRNRPAILRYSVAAAAANFALIVFYWSTVYTAAGKHPVKPAAATILLGAGTLAAAAVGALLSVLRGAYYRSKATVSRDVSREGENHTADT